MRLRVALKLLWEQGVPSSNLGDHPAQFGPSRWVSYFQTPSP
jgi:hypothetical protein